MSKIIDLSKYKSDRLKPKPRYPKNRDNISFEERMQRIQESLEKINELMRDFKTPKR